jgi:hypothetical protein
VAATDTRPGRLRRLAAAVRRALAEFVAAAARRRAAAQASSAARAFGVVGGLLAGSGAGGVELPEDRADAMYHRWEGGGLTAHGPALLVRKSIADKVSLAATYYVDMLSNASIDVVTTASPYKETRNEYGVVADYVYRNSHIVVGGSNSSEPDYEARAVNLDVAQEVFGGMSAVSLGFSSGSDDVGKKNSPEFAETARHWRYRIGLTQILSPRWLANLNFEAVSDDGFLGSPYRTALVFGASVPERVPSTRSSRAVKLGILGEVAGNQVAYADYRYFWDNWDIGAHTFGAGYRRYFGDRLLADVFLRYYQQEAALFYSDNAQTETLYVSRNRQLSTFSSIGAGARISYRAATLPGGQPLLVNGAYEFVSYRFDDFTDVRTGSLYSYNAHVLQLLLTTKF